MSAGDQTGPSSLSASASQQVQAILEAAEAGAEAIRREALEEAESIRTQAHADAGRASESIEAALRRLEALHSELGALIASLRTGEGAPASEAPEPGTSEPQVSEPQVSEPEAGEAGPAPAESQPAASAEDDVAGVRLIALNMALDGTPREQTAHFLAENFSVTDPERLLDEVYASAGA